MARLFSATTDKLQKNSAGSTATDNYTWFGTIFPKLMSGSQFLVHNGHGVDTGAGWGVHLNSTFQVLVDFAFVASYNSGLRVKLNQWNAIGYVRRAGTSILFVNGRKATTTSVSTPLAISAFYTLGARCNSAGTSSSAFKGAMADSALWGRGLSDPELFLLTRRLIRPGRIRGGLAQYHRLYGQGSTETALYAGQTLTVTGATKAENPPLLNSLRLIKPNFQIAKAGIVVLSSQTIFGDGLFS